jgi:hypothetical protein
MTEWLDGVVDKLVSDKDLAAKLKTALQEGQYPGPDQSQIITAAEKEKIKQLDKWDIRVDLDVPDPSTGAPTQERWFLGVEGFELGGPNFEILILHIVGGRIQYFNLNYVVEFFTMPARQPLPSEQEEQKLHKGLKVHKGLKAL